MFVELSSFLLTSDLFLYNVCVISRGFQHTTKKMLSLKLWSWIWFNANDASCQCKIRETCLLRRNGHPAFVGCHRNVDALCQEEKWKHYETESWHHRCQKIVPKWKQSDWTQNFPSQLVKGWEKMEKTLFGASISILFHFLDLFASVGSPLPKIFIGKLATGDARPKGSCVFIYRVNPSNKSFFKFCSVYLLFCRILWQHLLNKIIGSAEALPEVPRGHDFWYIWTCLWHRP